MSNRGQFRLDRHPLLTSTASDSSMNSVHALLNLDQHGTVTLLEERSVTPRTGGEDSDCRTVKKRKKLRKKRERRRTLNGQWSAQWSEDKFYSEPEVTTTKSAPVPTMTDYVSSDGSYETLQATVSISWNHVHQNKVRRTSNLLSLLLVVAISPSSVCSSIKTFDRQTFDRQTFEGQKIEMGT